MREPSCFLPSSPFHVHFHVHVHIHFLPSPRITRDQFIKDVLRPWMDEDGDGEVDGDFGTKIHEKSVWEVSAMIFDEHSFLSLSHTHTTSSAMCLLIPCVWYPRW